MTECRRRLAAPHLEDDRPAAAAPPSPEPLGSLSCLPEVLFAHMCSFLPGRDVSRLGGSCVALHESPHSLWPRLKLCLRGGLTGPDEADEGGRQRRAQALCMLARRAAGGLRELRMGESGPSAPFFSAVRAGGQPLRLLTSLHVDLSYGEATEWRRPDRSVGRPQQLLAEMVVAGQLPMLRELQLTSWEAARLGPMWRALGEGACPRLERLSMEDCSVEELTEMAEAVAARPESCGDLRAVCGGAEGGSWMADEVEHRFCEAVKAMLSRLAPASLEELKLRGLLPSSLEDAVLPSIKPGCAALTTLALDFDYTYDRVAADGLLHALARGAAPGLTSLDLSHCTCSNEAWLALGEAMGPAGACLGRLKALCLFDVWDSSDQVEIFTRAVGAGHGCPELESLDIGLEEEEEGGVHFGPCGSALAHAFRPPRGLPRLKNLRLHAMDLGGMDRLTEVLGHRPHAVEPIEKISMVLCYGEGAGRAIGHAGVLAGLKELVVNLFVEGEDGRWARKLAEALAGGAGQQLERIYCHMQETEAVNYLLQTLASQSACPRLQSLDLLATRQDAAAEERWLDACSLGEILAGRAACSATLKKLSLCDLELSNVGVRTLAACLRGPAAVQLEWLSLCAGQHDCATSVMELLSALQGHAGSGLRRFTISLPRCEQSGAVRVVDHLVDIIKAGGLPAIAPFMGEGAAVNGPWQFYHMMKVSVHPQRFDIGADKVEQAVASRAEAWWLASW